MLGAFYFWWSAGTSYCFEILNQVRMTGLGVVGWTGWLLRCGGLRHFVTLRRGSGWCNGSDPVGGWNTCGYLGGDSVRMGCVQLNTATADSWSRREYSQRGNALGAIRGLDRAGIVVSGDLQFYPGLGSGFFIGFFVTFRSSRASNFWLVGQTGGRMPTDKGRAAVAEMKDIFEASPLVIAAEYSGVDVAGMTGLRQELRSNGARFKIVKNTFARLAADEAGKSELKEVMTGPIGFVITEGDPAAAAKAFVKYSDDNDLSVNIVGGMLDSDVLSPDRVKALAKLPSKDELVAKLLGSMNSPITGLVMVMSGTVRALATVLQRHVDNQQTGEAA